MRSVYLYYAPSYILRLEVQNPSKQSIHSPGIRGSQAGSSRRRGARRRLSPTPPLRSPWRRQAVALVRRRRGLAEAQRRSAARRARTPAKKAAASSSVNPATGQTPVSDTTENFTESASNEGKYFSNFSDRSVSRLENFSFWTLLSSDSRHIDSKVGKFERFPCEIWQHWSFKVVLKAFTLSRKRITSFCLPCRFKFNSFRIVHISVKKPNSAH